MRFSCLLYTDRVISPLNIGEIFVPTLYRQSNLAAKHRWDFRAYFIQTELPRRWISARFSCLLYTDRISSPLNIGEIFVPTLYRQSNLAAKHRWDFRAYFIQTELSRRWTSARFSCLLYTDRVTSPLIGEIFVLTLYRQSYLAAEHRRDFRSYFIQTELPRRWTSARFSCWLYTDRVISPLNIGEIFVLTLLRQNYLAADHRRDFRAYFIQTELPRRWTSARFSCSLNTDRISSPLNIGEIFVRYIRKIKFLHIETFT